MASKFRKTWGTQTEIGRRFNISAVAVGKLLSEAGLRDATTKEPTSEALSGGFAVSTPMKNDRPFFMWNREKVAKLLRGKGVETASLTESETARVFAETRRYLTAKHDSDKMERITWQLLDMVFDDTMSGVNNRIRSVVRANVIAKLVAEKIIDHGTLS